MKKLLLTTFLLVFGVVGITNVYAINITIPDLVSSGTGWYGPQENQEVEPGAVTGQVWDLEKFIQQNNTLTIQSGFNLKEGYYDENWHRTWYSGDIFIDVTGDVKYGPAADGTGSGESIISNANFLYDYVFDMDFPNNTYTVYALNSSSLVSVFFSQFEEANPWRYYSGGTTIGSGIIGYPGNFSDSEGTHYLISVNLEKLNLPVGTEFTSHFTYECGNDNLMGRSIVVPEPATIFLLGSGLLGLAGLGRKKLFRKFGKEHSA